VARRARLIIMGSSWGIQKASLRALLRPILGTTLGVILVILGLILRVLGGAQSALDYKPLSESRSGLGGLLEDLGPILEALKGPYKAL